MNPKTDLKWRMRRVEEYLQKCAEAENKPGKLRAIIRAEADPLVREYLKFRAGLTCTPIRQPKQTRRKLLHAIEHAHGWIAPASKNPEASMIRAMAVNGRKARQIAEEFDTEPRNVSVFLRLFFDVKPLLHFEALLRRAISQAQSDPAGDNVAPEESKWLRLAYGAKWDVLESVMLGIPLKDPKGVIERLDGQMSAQLAIRAREYTETRMTSSEPGSVSEFRSYLEHKRLLAKLKTKDDEFERARRDEYAQNLNALFDERLEENAKWIFRVYTDTPEWRHAILEEQIADDRWATRLEYFVSHPDDAHLQEAEAAEYQKSLEERRKRRAQMVEEVRALYKMRYDDTGLPELLTPAANSETEYRRSDRWE